MRAPALYANRMSGEPSGLRWWADSQQHAQARAQAPSPAQPAMLAVAAAAGALIMIASLVACNAMWAPGPWSEHTQPPVDQLDLSTVWSERAHQELQIEIFEQARATGGMPHLEHPIEALDLMVWALRSHDF
jgi:hypothetical protein